MIKTLYISDLDGTLLNSQKKIPEEALLLLKNQIKQGVMFTIATARSSASAQEYCEQLDLKLPVVLMNGVFVYDMHKKTYLHKNPIPPDAAIEALSMMSERQIWPFVFTLEGEGLCASFVRLDNSEMQDFYIERKNKSYKRFQSVESFATGDEVCTVYISTINTERVLRPVYEWALAHKKLAASLYRDNYSDCWYLEIYSAYADKETGMAWLKEYTGAERVIAFGDNYNDIRMLRAADEGYVVAEAPEEVRQCAYGVIGSNEDSAVARFISTHDLPGAYLTDNR